MRAARHLQPPSGIMSQQHRSVPGTGSSRSPKAGVQALTFVRGCGGEGGDACDKQERGPPHRLACGRDDGSVDLSPPALLGNFFSKTTPFLIELEMHSPSVFSELLLCHRELWFHLPTLPPSCRSLGKGRVSFC